MDFFTRNVYIGDRSDLRLIRLFAFLYLSIFLIGLVWMLFLCFQSPGTPVQDEIGHYLISKNAWVYPQLMLDVWGRAVNTMVYMVPALGGLLAARLFSVVLSVATVLIATGVAIEIGLRWIFLIPLFLWFQPWFVDLSYTVITEVPFSLCLILGIYLWLTGATMAAGVIFGLLSLIRHEGIVLLGLWCLFILTQMDWTVLAFSLLPILIYNGAYYMVYGDIIFAQKYLNPHPTDYYGSGSWGHFVPTLVEGAGFIVFGFATLSFPAIPKLGKKAWLFLLYASYFAMHTILFRFGLFASGGYGLFLLPLAPGIALAAGLGCEWAFARLDNLLQLRLAKHKHILILLSMVAIVVTTMGVGASVPPRPVDKEQIASQQAAEWLRNHGYSDEQIVSTHVWFYYYYDLPMENGVNWTQHPTLDEYPPDTVVVWDKHYSDRWNLFLPELTDPSNGWKELAEFEDGTIVLFQKQ